MEKRGQINQLFIIIFALVVAGMVIGFGYYAIDKLLNLGKEVETIKFEKEFEKQINLYYDFAPGTNANVKIRTPNDILAVCFLVGGDVNSIPGEYEDAKKVARLLGDEYNVFFSTKDKSLSADPLNIAKLKPSPDDDPLCINTANGVLDIDLINMGDHVQLIKHK